MTSTALPPTISIIPDHVLAKTLGCLRIDGGMVESMAVSNLPGPGFYFSGCLRPRCMGTCSLAGLAGLAAYRAGDREKCCFSLGNAG